MVKIDALAFQQSADLFKTGFLLVDVVSRDTLAGYSA